MASYEYESADSAAASLALTLDDAIGISLDRNPNLVALRASEPVAHAVYHVASTYPWNPYVQVQVLPYARDRNGNFGSVNNYVLLMQTLELAHQQRHREASASAAMEQVHWNVVQAELANAAQTERLYFTALYQQDLRDLAKRTAALNEELLAIVRRRFKAALATDAERITARVAARQSRKQADLAEASFQTAVLALRRQLNLSANEPLVLTGRLDRFDWLPAIDRPPTSEECLQMQVPDLQIATLANQRPDVLAAQAGVGTAAANAKLARANTIPNVQIGPYYQRNQSNTLFLGFRTQVDLPIWNTGGPLVQQRKAELMQQRLTFEQLRERAKVEAGTAINRYQRARRLLAREQSPDSTSVADLKRVKELFEAGQTDILNVFATQNAVLQERRTHLDLLNELAQAAADVTLFTGLPPARLITASAEPLPAPEPKVER